MDPRTYLFVPGNRPERFAKALGSGADRVVLDLEDAVALPAKGDARDAIARWSARASDADRARIVVRINDAQADAFADDLRLLRDARIQSVMLPKAESATQVQAVRAAVPRRARPASDRKRVAALQTCSRWPAPRASHAWSSARSTTPSISTWTSRTVRTASPMPPACSRSHRASRACRRRSRASRHSSTMSNACSPTSHGRAATASAPSCASIRARSRRSTLHSPRAQKPSTGLDACSPPKPPRPVPPSSTAE